MGDNRNRSSDSRSIGLIPRGNILGKAWIRIWPFSHFGFLGSGPTLASGSVILALPLPLFRRRRQVWKSIRTRRRAA
jgi:hypothetical protein